MANERDLTKEENQRLLFADYEHQLFAFATMSSDARLDPGPVKYRAKGRRVHREDWLALMAAHRTEALTLIADALGGDAGVIDKLDDIKERLTSYTDHHITGETIETGIADVIASRD